MSGSTYLPRSLLSTLLDEVNDDTIIGVALGGSFARGEATPYSDVDLVPFVRDDALKPPERTVYRKRRLVSISFKTCAEWRADMARPESAIFAVPCAKSLRILLDKDGSLHSLIDEARAFRWQLLQPAADMFANQMLVSQVEVVHKALSALVQNDTLALCKVVTGLLQAIPWALATQRGIQVVSSNTYLRQLEQQMGPGSAWTCALHEAFGIDPALPDQAANCSSIEARTIGTLHLYRETVRVLWEVLTPDVRVILNHTLKLICEVD